MSDAHGNGDSKAGVTCVQLPPGSSEELRGKVTEWLESRTKREDVRIGLARDSQDRNVYLVGARPREEGGVAVLAAAWSIIVNSLPYEGDGFRVVEEEDQVWAKPAEEERRDEEDGMGETE